ncbi:hypothetical protein J6590_059510 [Homalodisca vitripennis]|nr:hypothetical protein J6590_059510 [Homalodisca vitripennis]
MYGSICESRIDVRCFIRRRPHNSQPRNGRALHTLDTMLDELVVYTILLHLHVELGKSTRVSHSKCMVPSVRVGLMLDVSSGGEHNSQPAMASLAYTRHDVRRVGCLHDIAYVREIHKSESFKMYGSICESRIDVRCFIRRRAFSAMVELWCVGGVLWFWCCRCFIRRRPHNSQSRNGRALHTLDTMLDELGVYTILLHLHVELGKSTRSRIDVRCFIRRRPHNSRPRNGRALHTLDTMLDELGVYTILLHLHVELGKSTRSRIDVRCFIRRRPHNSQPRNGRALHTLDTMLDELGVYTILLHLHVELGKSTRVSHSKCMVPSVRVGLMLDVSSGGDRNSQSRRNGRALHTLDTMLDELGVYTILLHLHVELGKSTRAATAQFTVPQWPSLAYTRHDVRRVGCLHDIVTLACRAREIHKSESFKMYGSICESRIDVRCFIRRRPHNSQPRNGRALHTLDTMLDELGVYTILLHLHVELGKSTRSRIDVRCFIRRRPHNSQSRNGRALHTLDTMLDELGVYTILLHLHVELGKFTMVEPCIHSRRLHKLDCSQDTDFESELYIAQVLIPSVTVALFISTIDLVLNQLPPLFCLIGSSHKPVAHKA